MKFPEFGPPIRWTYRANFGRSRSWGCFGVGVQPYGQSRGRGTYLLCWEEVQDRPGESLMTAFKCPECQNYFDAPQFTPKEMEKGPWCPLCSARLERIPVDVLRRKPTTEIVTRRSSATWDLVVRFPIGEKGSSPTGRNKPERRREEA